MAGWQSRPFEDCIEPVVYTAKVQRKDFLAAGAFPVVSQEDAFVNGFWDIEADLFRVDRPVVVFGDHTRALKYIDFDFVLGADGVKILKPKPFLHPRFFYYQLHTAKLDSLGYARHYRLLKEHHVAYPAYAEQQRIAAILDEAFEAIARAKVNTEKNLQNARELFDTKMELVFLAREKDWVSTKLGNAFRTLTGNTPSKANAANFGAFMPLVKPPELLDDYVDDAADGLSQSGALVSRVLPVGSVLVSCIGNLGKIGINSVPVACNQQINAILPDENKAVPEFMFFQALARPFKRQLEAAASGTTVPIVNKSKFNEIEVFLPSLQRQHEVVGLLRALRAESDRLVTLFEQKVTALDELKKSLLHQAFTGQFTAKSTDQQLEAVA